MQESVEAVKIISQERICERMCERSEVVDVPKVSHQDNVEAMEKNSPGANL